MSLRFPSPLRWTPAAVVASLICYWSIVASPPSIVPPLEVMVTEGGVTQAAVAGGSGLAWLDIRHGLAYATLAVSLEYALGDRDAAIARTVLLVFCVTVGYGALMEVGQLFRPDRTASLADAASNTVGAVTVLARNGLE